MTASADVIVVGLGAAGGVIAERLASAGARVIGLEKGQQFTDDDFRFKHDEIRYYSRGAILPRMETDPITWRASESQQAAVLPWALGPLAVNEPLHSPPSIGTGGGTVHWGGAYWRFAEADFRMRSAIVERFGADALPQDTDIRDWPISYAELEPYYDQAEWELGISGRAGNLGGELVEGGNPFEGPRTRDYPMPPLKPGGADGEFVEAARRLGMHPAPQAAAIASEDWRGRPSCTYCGFCHGFPCHVGAKMSTQVAALPAALATGNLEIRPFARVFRVDRDTAGRARGVSYFDSTGVVHEVSAPIVVLCSYAIENTRLLLASGVNENGQTGSYFMTHLHATLSGVLAEATNPFMGPFVACSAADDYNSDRIPDNELGVVWGSVITSGPGDFQPIESAHSLPPDVPRWGAGFKSWLRENFSRTHHLFTQIGSLPSQRWYCDLDPNVRDRYGQPVLRITHDWTDHDANSVEVLMRVKRRLAEEMGMVRSWESAPRPAFHISTHDVGMHRMGEDPRSSVVDRFGECHECEGLYAVGGGMFPTCPGYNPTGTILALAYWVGDHIREQAGVRATAQAVSR